LKKIDSLEEKRDDKLDKNIKSIQSVLSQQNKAINDAMDSMENKVNISLDLSYGIVGAIFFSLVLILGILGKKYMKQCMKERREDCEQRVWKRMQESSLSFDSRELSLRVNNSYK